MSSASARGSSTAPESSCAPASRAFSSTAIASGAPPRDCCSAASVSAADRPAGPPPTISTSTSRASRSMREWVLLLQLRGQRGQEVEQVSHVPVVGHLENRRLGVLVDRDNRPRALHADHVLNRPGDADRYVELRRHRLAGAANLTFHGEPAAVADRA